MGDEKDDQANVQRERDEGLKRLRRIPPRLHKDEPSRGKPTKQPRPKRARGAD